MQDENWLKKNLVLTPGEAYERCSFLNLCDRCGLCDKSSQITPTKHVSFGSNNPVVLVVQPYITDDDTGACSLFGNSQIRDTLVNYLAEALGFPPDKIFEQVRFTALTRCPGGKKGPAKEYFKHCTDYLAMEIAQFKPRIVLGLGGRAGFDVHEALGLPKRVRGFVQEVPRFIPLNSRVDGDKRKAHLDRGDFPCHVLKTSDFGWAIREPFVFEEIRHDFLKLELIITGEYPKLDTFAGRNYTVVQDADYAIQVCEYLSKLDTFAFDIETGPALFGLESYAKESKILCIGFADKQRNAWVIPLDHKDCPYKERLAEVHSAVQKALQSPAEKVAHNMPFDAVWFPVKFGYHVANLHFDTQVAHGLLNENVSHKLKYLAELYTDLGYYDDDLLDGFRDAKGKKVPENKRCFESHITLATLGTYCCCDVDATMQLRLLFEQQLHQLGLLNYFYTLTMPDVRSVIVTHLTGIALDVAHHTNMTKEFTSKLTQAKDVLANLPEHKHWKHHQALEKKGSGKYFLHESGWLYRGYTEFCTMADQPIAFVDEVTKLVSQADSGVLNELRNLGIIQKRTPKLSSAKVYLEKDINLNANSPKKLVEFLFGKQFCNLQSSKQTDSGGISTEADVLKSLKDMSPACQAILDVRTWEKAFGTYCVPYTQGAYEFVDDKGKKRSGIGYIKADGLLHPSFIMTGNDRGTTKDQGKGTRTGRKSAVDPPIQTQKQRGEGAKLIKKLYVTRYLPGVELFHAPYAIVRSSVLGASGFITPLDRQGGLMQWDFSQLELRLFAMIAGIAWMLQRYKVGADLHLELAMELFTKTAEECLANDKEFRGHAKEFWFGPVYGESARGIQQQLAKKGFVITIEEAESLLQKMYDKMPEYEAYKRNCEEMLNDGCSIYTVTGRRRFLPTWLSSEKYIRAQALRQAGNFRIQSPGSDMTTWSWFTLNEWLALVKLQTRINISVHDSLVFDSPPDELGIVAVAAEYVMTHVPFKFLEGAPIPIVADGEAGRSWGQMVGLDDVLKVPEGVNQNDWMWTLHSDLWQYVNTEITPMSHWRSIFHDDARLDLLKEKCRVAVL